MLGLWTASRVEALDETAQTAVSDISDRLQAAAVKAPGAQQAWGQFVDPTNHSRTQWGYYGTAAAVRALGIADTAQGREVGEQAAVHLLPASVKNPPEPAHTPDLADPVKMAFVASALVVAKPGLAHATPPLVEDILEQIEPNLGIWKTNRDADFQADAAFVPTASIVLSLAGYADARADPRYTRACDWIAERIATAQLTPVEYALGGLALAAGTSKASGRTDSVAQALTRCESRLDRWSRKLKTSKSLLEHETRWFQRPKNHDYLILHPAILASLFFLRVRERAPGSFVLRVVAEVCGATDKYAGFAGQDKAASTVDQMWATTLLTEFRARTSALGAHAMVPSTAKQLDPAGPLARVAAFVVIVLLLAGAYVLLRPSAGVGVVGAFALFAVVVVLTRLSARIF